MYNSQFRRGSLSTLQCFRIKHQNKILQRLKHLFFIQTMIWFDLNRLSMFSVTHHWWRRRKREWEWEWQVDNLLQKRFKWERESEYIESLLTTVYAGNTKQVVEKMGKVGELSWQNGFRICWKDPECSVTQKILFTQLPLVRDQLLWGHISTAITLTESFLKVTFSFSCF